MFNKGQHLTNYYLFREFNWKRSYQFLYFIGGFNVIIGALGIFFNISSIFGFSSNGFTIIYGFIFFILAYNVSQLSLPALIVSIILYSIDTIYPIALSVFTGKTSFRGNIYGYLGIRLFLLYFILIPAIDIVKDLQKDKDTQLSYSSKKTDPLPSGVKKVQNAKDQNKDESRLNVLYSSWSNQEIYKAVNMHFKDYTPLARKLLLEEYKNRGLGDKVVC